MGVYGKLGNFGDPGTSKQPRVLVPTLSFDDKHQEKITINSAKCCVVDGLFINVLFHFAAGVLINIECKAWAKNIFYDRYERRGSVHFELMVDKA